LPHRHTVYTFQMGKGNDPRSNGYLSEKKTKSLEWTRPIFAKSHLALGLLTAHTTLTTFVMQLSRQNGRQSRRTSPAIVVLTSEILKIVICFAWILIMPRLKQYYKSRRISTSSGEDLYTEKAVPVQVISLDYRDEKGDTLNRRETMTSIARYIGSAEGLIMIIPSILYVLQNMLQIYGIPYVSAVTYQSLCQFKIVATAVLSVLILGSKVNTRQWISLILLTMGVIQVVSFRSARLGILSPVAKFQEALILQPTFKYWDVNPFLRRKRATLSDFTSLNKALSQVSRHLSETKLAVASIVFASILGSFSGVFLESRLKKNGNLREGRSLNRSLATKNICLATYSIVTLIIVLLLEAITRYGKTSGLSFQGFNRWTFLFIFMRACSGLLVAASLQYADSISKSG
jgi:uncharacterized membrane protein